MEEKSSRKRPFYEDDDSNKPPSQKRVRFPKGKKVKPEYQVVDKRNADEDTAAVKEARLAAKERAKRRNQITAELLGEATEGFLNDVTAAEETYEGDGTTIEEGIQMEPFNLNKEREEGYFDDDGNFVEYANGNEVKDAWLDSIEADPKYTGRGSAHSEAGIVDNESENEDAVNELSAQDIGTIKRRITNVLESGETVLHALRRLKGNSNNRKEKMSAETKRVFDLLTEDTDRLIQNGEYNVYHEKKEVFQREAEGYERLAQAKEGNDDDVDMFADDDGQAAVNPSSDSSTLASGLNSDVVTQSTSETPNMDSQTSHTEGSSDYVYDEASGYYYSSSSGYYYDPSTGLYGLASTGQWFSFNEETGSYDEIQDTGVN